MQLITPERVMQSVRGVLNGTARRKAEVVQIASAARS